VAEFLGDASFLPDESGRLVMARPHDLAVSVGGNAVVTARRYLGTTWRYRVRLTDGTEIHSDGGTAPGVEPLAVGDACTVSVIATHELHRLSP
jgi:hypothetical protein